MSNERPGSTGGPSSEPAPLRSMLNWRSSVRLSQTLLKVGASQVSGAGL